MDRKVCQAGKGIYQVAAGEPLYVQTESDKLSPFSSINSVILFILLLIVSHRFSDDTLKFHLFTFVYITVHQTDARSIT